VGMSYLSSANLNQDYFQNRQDRYVSIHSGLLSVYFSELIHLISEFSYNLTGGELIPSKYTRGVSNHTFKHNFHSSLLSFCKRWFKNTQDDRDALTAEMTDTKAYICPTIQLFPLSIQQDELATTKLLSEGMKHKNDQYHILAGYFNLPAFFANRIMDSKAHFNLITSAPEANGFYGSQGVSRFIPTAYSYLETLFLGKVQKHKREDGVKLFEYKKKGWTWHSKGIWYFGDQGGFATVVGSSNMNYRSWRRDLECQLLIFTKNPYLKNRFHENLMYLYQDSSLVDLDSVSRRNIPFTLKLVTRIIRNML
jgi:CDP-diacylglycerol---glycerol-3-phosphate 3-phosphatidyltransferase